MTRASPKQLIRLLIVVLFAGVSIFTGTVLYSIRSLAPRPAAADTRVTVMDNLDQEGLDANKWRIVGEEGGSVAQTYGKVYVRRPLKAGVLSGKGVEYIYTIKGDFDIEIEVSGLLAGGNGGGSAEICFDNTNYTAHNCLAWRKANTTSANYIDVNTVASPGTQPVFSGKLEVPSQSLNLVRLKMTRNGNVVQGFADIASGAGLILVGTLPNAYDGEGVMSFKIFNHGESGSPRDVEADFDRFNANVTLVGNPFPSPTPTPGDPNNCGGTCGSNYNCKGGLYCYQGFCRNPLCKTDASCACASPTPYPTPTPTAVPVVSTCGGGCRTSAGCSAGLFCYNGKCKNPTCIDSERCSCIEVPPPPPLPTPAMASPTPSGESVIQVVKLSWWERIVEFLKRLVGGRLTPGS